jgi:Ni/Fe-hydrogenase subunit HybB-like protein
LDCGLRTTYRDGQDGRGGRSPSHHPVDPVHPCEFPATRNRSNPQWDRLLPLSFVGAIAFALALVQTPERAWANLLISNYFFVSLALFGAVFVALSYVFSSGWAVVFRRVPEAMTAYLPVGAALMLALYFGCSELYLWARPEAVAGNTHLQHKAVYLNVPFFFARMVVAFAVWLVLVHLLRRHSRQQDLDGAPAHTRQNQVYAAVFMGLFAVTFIFSVFDWIMSLEPEWYSTMFPLYNFAGLFLSGVAAMLLLVIALGTRGLLPGVTVHHIHELGRILAAAGTFWFYVWFSQSMLIYYTNIPEEAVYYARRLAHGGHVHFFLTPVLCWLVPLTIMLSSRARRSLRWLAVAALVALAGRWLDLYMLIMPAVSPTFRFTLLDFLIPLGLLPLFLIAAAHSFRRAEPVPRHDPYLAESVHLLV